MSNLPVDLIADILSRLPVKKLLCFRCVSKPWCSLIDGPDFIKLQIKQSIEANTNQTLLLQDSDLYSVDFNSLDAAAEFHHPLMCYNHSIKVLGSCNGLLLICNVVDDIALWNPSTKKYNVLPLLSLELKRYSGTPVCPICVYGLGYDPINDDYKVVRIAQFSGLNRQFYESEVKVYSLRRNAWRRIKDIPYGFSYPGVNGVFVSGALHWVVIPNSESDKEKVIVALDLGVEDYKEVTLPEFMDKKFHMELGVLQGCLCVVANYHDVCADVWVMKEYGSKESWVRLFSVSQSELIGTLRSVRPLAYSQSGSEVLLEHDKIHLFWYDLRKKRVKNTRIRNLPLTFEAEIFLQSLVSLNVKRGYYTNKHKAGDDKQSPNKRDDFLSEGFKLVL